MDRISQILGVFCKLVFVYENDESCQLSFSFLVLKKIIFKIPPMQFIKHRSDTHDKFS
jgi:hypothetical protein